MVRISGHRPQFNPRWDRVFLGVGFGRHATCLVILLYENPASTGVQAGFPQPDQVLMTTAIKRN